MESRLGAAHTFIMRKAQPNPKPVRRPTFIRAWRDFRGYTQEQMITRLEAAGLKLSTSQLSRIENGKQEYKQSQLEVFAVALNCEPWNLIWRDPKGPASLIDQVAPLSPEQQRRVADFITGMGVPATGTKG
jgi:transcriptional regulator with XRE-family HTH domain